MCTSGHDLQAIREIRIVQEEETDAVKESRYLGLFISLLPRENASCSKVREVKYMLT